MIRTFSRYPSRTSATPGSLILRLRLRSVLCCTADPFADAADQDGDTSNAKDYVHIRIQQRNGKKSLTTIQVSHSALLLAALVSCSASGRFKDVSIVSSPTCFTVLRMQRFSF